MKKVIGGFATIANFSIRIIHKVTNEFRRLGLEGLGGLERSSSPPLSTLPRSEDRCHFSKSTKYHENSFINFKTTISFSTQ
jgi:hypothetical protein